MSVVVQAAVFEVTNNQNSGSGSLRQAIVDANANPGPDQIRFAIPATNAAGVTISLTEELPALQSGLVIMGDSQPTVFFNSTSTRIQLTRGTTELISGLKIIDASNIEIYGIFFVGFDVPPSTSLSDLRGAIYLRNARSVVIGHANRGNAFAENYAGIYAPLDPHQLHDIQIQANYFGLSPKGDDRRPNKNGIDVSYLRNSFIGGGSLADGNVFADAENRHINTAGMADDVYILHNRIGFDASGKFIPNPRAIGIDANGLQCKLHIENNIIAGQRKGVLLTEVNSGFFMRQNRIGTGPLGTENYGNAEAGIEIVKCAWGNIGELDDNRNYIAYNTDGILVNNSMVTITKNSIYCNTRFPIRHQDMTVTLPIVTAITASGIRGTYLPNSTIEVFGDDECGGCQGKYFIGEVNTAADGSWIFNGAISGAITVTGTANRSTSNFTSPVLNDQQVQITSEQCGQKNGSIRNIKVSDASVYRWYDEGNNEVATTADLLNVKAGKYYLVAGQDGGCNVMSPTYEIKSVTVFYKVKEAALAPSACGKTNGSVVINSFEADIPTVFEWLDADDNVVSRERNLTGAGPGTYRIFGDNGLGCKELAGSFTIMYSEDLMVRTNRVQVVNTDCLKDEGTISNVQIVGGTLPYTYQWFNENDQLAGEQADLVNAASGKYYLKITDSKGCTALGDFVTIPPSLGNAKIANTFSPNGDGVNDVWRIPGLIGLSNFEVKIFNRQGTLVFHAKNVAKDFDGRFNNADLPVGVYYYYIDLKNNCKSLNGSLTLIR